MGQLTTWQPCPSTALAVLGAVDPDGVMLRCCGAAGHVGKHYFRMEWTDPKHDTEDVVDRTTREEIETYLNSRRDDPDFMRRLRERIDKDADILRRLDDGHDHTRESEDQG